MTDVSVNPSYRGAVPLSVCVVTQFIYWRYRQKLLSGGGQLFGFALGDFGVVGFNGSDGVQATTDGVHVGVQLTPAWVLSMTGLFDALFG